MAGEHKSPKFLAMNPLGEVPILDDDGYILRDSQAILVYLASKYGGEAWLPKDPAHAAKVMQGYPPQLTRCSMTQATRGWWTCLATN